jgi:hypothetical protein
MTRAPIKPKKAEATWSHATPSACVGERVHCPSCRREQGDQGRGATCVYCGTSPLPSHAYPRGHAFYPRPPVQSLEELVKKRRAAYAQEHPR